MINLAVSFQACLIELWSSKHRIFVACIKDFLGPFCLLLQSFLAYFIRDRMEIHIVSAIVCALTLVSWFATPESIR